MANEKGKKSKPEQEKHESWLEEAMDKINTDFPLSGGETEEDFEDATEVDENENEDGDEEKEKGADKLKPEQKKKSWIDDINVDTDFPLSGGKEEDK